MVYSHAVPVPKSEHVYIAGTPRPMYGLSMVSNAGRLAPDVEGESTLAVEINGFC